MVKRGKGTGFSGLESSLSWGDKTRMLAGDGPEIASQLIQGGKDMQSLPGMKKPPAGGFFSPRALHWSDSTPLDSGLLQPSPTTQAAQDKPMQNDPLELWNFAVALYEEEDVKAACLRVQARYGLSISLLLGAIWIGVNGLGRLGATDLETAIRRAMEWHREVIEPIRALRRQLRREPPQGVESQAHELRHQLVEAELGAERIEMRLLLQDLPPQLPVAPPAERWRDAAVNAALMMRKSCPQLEDEAEGALVQIIHAASPATPLADLHQEIRSVWLLS